MFSDDNVQSYANATPTKVVSPPYQQRADAGIATGIIVFRVSAVISTKNSTNHRPVTEMGYTTSGWRSGFAGGQRLSKLHIATAFVCLQRVLIGRCADHMFQCCQILTSHLKSSVFSSQSCNVSTDMVFFIFHNTCQISQCEK